MMDRIVFPSGMNLPENSTTVKISDAARAASEIHPA